MVRGPRNAYAWYACDVTKGGMALDEDARAVRPYLSKWVPFARTTGKFSKIFLRLSGVEYLLFTCLFLPIFRMLNANKCQRGWGVLYLCKRKWE